MRERSKLVTGRSRAGAGAVVALLALALPGAAQAATKTVNMGIPPSAGKAFQPLGVDVNDFFPHGVTIHKGDKIKFLPVGFHSFDFPPRGGDMLSLITPTGQDVSGENDAAGQPFWFNGQDQVSFNPVLAAGATFGKKLSFNGKKRIISGLPLAPKVKPITVTFKKTGTFTYYCNIHAGMKGKVTVKAKSAKIPSAKSDKKALARQIATALSTSKKLPKTQVPANTVDVGAAGKHGEELFAFVPDTLTVPVGTSVTFRMSPGSYDIHTATTGPGDPEKDPNSYLGQLAKKFADQPVPPGQAVYRSEPPGTQGTLTPALHGNGFWNSGLMDNSKGSPIASSDSVKFGAVGTYDFYCMVHPFMHARVTVQ
jgi:plastocyanin